MKKRNEKFPTFAIVVLLFAIAWFFNELGIFVVNIPWLPTILIVISIGWIFNRLM
jgi:hypothetical protein